MPLRRIRLRQSGGFGGLLREADLTIDTLDPRKRSELLHLYQASGLGEPTAAGAPSAGGPGQVRDFLQYDLEVESTDGTITRTFNDADLPAGVAALVAFLQPHMKPASLRRPKT